MEQAYTMKDQLDRQLLAFDITIWIQEVFCVGA
jgi:hypothetical protein